MLTVCNYHYIRPNFDTNYPSIFGVTPSAFKKQLKLLKDEGDFVSPQDLISNVEVILSSKNNYYFVTFDDGLKEQFQYALPILDELQIPAIFFANSKNHENLKVSTVHKIHLLRSIMAPSDFLKKVTSFEKVSISSLDQENAKKTYIYDNVDSAILKYILNFKMNFAQQEDIIKTVFEDFFNEEEELEKLYMNQNEIIHLANQGYLGSHTHAHYPLGLLKSSDIQFELEHSKAFFEKYTSSKIEMVAYPYGSPEACNIAVATIAANVNYKLGFTTTRGINTENNNLLLLNRFDCNDLPGGKNYRPL
jgi:peptidoglycan/xylan/chitin deacetylase (PgdA/CDA1 family)